MSRDVLIDFLHFLVGKNERMNVGLNIKGVGSRKVVREREYQEQFRVRGEQETKGEEFQK